jgi:hypothetical protein
MFTGTEASGIPIRGVIMKHIMKHFSFPGILFPLALWACPAANAQTVVATDETLKTQVFEITGWDMGTNDHWWAFPAPVFDCRKIASVSVAIQSDIINNGRPDIFPMAKLSRLVDNGNAGEKGGTPRSNASTTTRVGWKSA